MLTLKPKKVFEKVSKLNRKQAYTIGAITVVIVVAILMLASMSTTPDESMEGLTSHGYDLAQMPFVNDEAERALLASAYPDMKGNTSSFLYTPAQRAEREEEDANSPQEETQDTDTDTKTNNTYTDPFSTQDDDASDGDYTYRGGRGTGGSHGSTEINQIGVSGMATSGGSGIGSSFGGPIKDAHVLKDQYRGHQEAPQLRVGSDKEAVNRFRTDTHAAAALRNNRMQNLAKAVQGGGGIDGSDAFGKDGKIDMSKLGGLTIDTSAPSASHDLKDIAKGIDNAAKKAGEKDKQKQEEELSWFEKLLQNLAERAANHLVDSVFGGIGDSIQTGINANAASRAARKEYGADFGGKWSDLSDSQRTELTNAGYDESKWNSYSVKQRGKKASKLSGAVKEGKTAKRSYLDEKTTQIGSGTKSQKCSLTQSSCGDKTLKTNTDGTCYCG